MRRTLSAPSTSRTPAVTSIFAWTPPRSLSTTPPSAAATICGRQMVQLNRPSVGQKCERKREHRGPGGSDQQVRHAEQVLVVDERNGDEADGSDQKAHHIGQFQGAELRKHNRPQD